MRGIGVPRGEEGEVELHRAVRGKVFVIRLDEDGHEL